AADRITTVDKTRGLEDRTRASSLRRGMSPGPNLPGQISRAVSRPRRNVASSQDFARDETLFDGRRFCYREIAAKGPPNGDMANRAGDKGAAGARRHAISKLFQRLAPALGEARGSVGQATL